MQNLSGGKTVFGLDQNVGALLCYLPILFIHLIVSIAVIVQDKENKLVRFHAFQSLFFSITMLVLSFVLGIAAVILSFAGIFIDAAIGTPLVTFLMMIVIFLIFGVFLIGSFACIIIAMIKAYGLQKWKIPVIGNFAEKYAG